MIIPAAFWVGTGAVQIALLGGVCLIVLIVAPLNAAILAMVHRASPNVHEYYGHTMNMGSATVLISLCLAGTIWAMILWQRLA